MLDIFKELSKRLINDMDDHVSNEKYIIGTIKTVTHEELLEFDSEMGKLCKGKPYDICLFHPRRIRCDADERLYCRLTTIGSVEKVCYHICVDTEDKPADGLKAEITYVDEF